MLLLTPILIAVGATLLMYQFGAWKSARELDSNSTPLRDPRLTPAVRRLARALDLPEVRVHVLEVQPVNGLAAPDGRIFLTRGFLKRHNAGEITTEELVSVVAHELGHVALGHSNRRMLDFSGANALRVVLVMTLGRLIPGLGLVIANALTGLLTARLSRQDEYEADAYAAALLTKAGLGVTPQVNLLAKLDRMAGHAGGGPVWMLSHPPTQDRIAAIRALEQRWEQH